MSESKKWYDEKLAFWMTALIFPVFFYSIYKTNLYRKKGKFVISVLYCLLVLYSFATKKQTPPNIETPAQKEQRMAEEEKARAAYQIAMDRQMRIKAQKDSVIREAAEFMVMEKYEYPFVQKIFKKYGTPQIRGNAYLSFMYFSDHDFSIRVRKADDMIMAVEPGDNYNEE